MKALGKVRIGHKAPDFHCEAVVKGVIQEVSLSTYIHPSIKPGTHNPDLPWLILLFIPAAFSFVCPTEVLAFQNCIDEFKDRNCSVVFVSVDTKHSLWHWQNVPRQYGGLGQIDIPLLSDSNHRLSRDYGVLIEDEGVSLRGMFMIDGEGIVQQVTMNNLTVGRSVVEALRLLDAFQAVAKHGVLCPIDWKPSGDAADTLNTISNTLTESYDERLANLQKEVGGIAITTPHVKHKTGDTLEAENHDDVASKNHKEVHEAKDLTSTRPSISHSSPQPLPIQEMTYEHPIEPSDIPSFQNYCLPHFSTSPPMLNTTDSYNSMRSISSTSSTMTSPRTTTYIATSLSAKRNSSIAAAHPLRGSSSSRARMSLDQQHMSSLFSQSAPSLFPTLVRSRSANSRGTSPAGSTSGDSTAPPTPGLDGRSKSSTSNSTAPRLKTVDMYDSRNGSHGMLECASPSPSPRRSPKPLLTSTPSDTFLVVSRKPPPTTLSRSTSWQGPALSSINTSAASIGRRINS